MNTEKILEGLRAAKTAFEETLEYCKKPGFFFDEIISFSNDRDTDLGICYFLEASYFNDAEDFVRDFFTGTYLSRAICHLDNWEFDFKDRCIQVTETRVEWLESKIKELEANQ